MAKGKKKSGKSPADDAKSGSDQKPKRTKVKDTAARAKDKAVELASNPLVAEIVAATLVAAAAAIRDPKKAREIANAAGEELGKVSKLASGTNPFWQLAMDVAKKSISAIDSGSPAKLGDPDPETEPKAKKAKPKKKKS